MNECSPNGVTALLTTHICIIGFPMLVKSKTKTNT